MSSVQVCCFVISSTNYHVVWCGVIGGYGHNDANDNNRRVHLAFSTHKWNVVNLNVTSFLAPKLNISGMRHKADFTPNLTLWWNPRGEGPISEGKVVIGRWPLQLDHRGSPLKTTGKCCVFVSVRSGVNAAYAPSWYLQNKCTKVTRERNNQGSHKAVCFVVLPLSRM